MKISTLEYIHQIMKNDVEYKRHVYDEARERLRAKRVALDEGVGGDSIFEQSERDFAKGEYETARDALTDFESHEF